jgi:hypothetical protein
MPKRTYRFFLKSVGIILPLFVYSGFFRKVSELFLFFLQQIRKKRRIYVLGATLSQKNCIYAVEGKFFKENPDTFGIYAEYT